MNEDDLLEAVRLALAHLNAQGAVLRYILAGLWADAPEAIVDQDRTAILERMRLAATASDGDPSFSLEDALRALEEAQALTHQILEGAAAEAAAIRRVRGGR